MEYTAMLACLVASVAFGIFNDWYTAYLLTTVAFIIQNHQLIELRRKELI